MSKFKADSRPCKCEAWPFCEHASNVKPKPKLLDLFCCAGGAGMGYHQAGFDVTGVDIKPQPRYPFRFVQADALDYLAKHGHEYDFIHASPPCQGYSKHVSSRSSQYVRTKGKDEPQLIAATRKILVSLENDRRSIGHGPNDHVWWVIENVVGARREMMAPILLCGSMFGLPIARHRLFETSWMIMQPEHPDCRGIAKRFAEAKGWDYRDMSCTGKGRRAGTAERWKEILGIGHEMSQHELAESIPPSYTRWIGEQWMKQTEGR